MAVDLPRAIGWRVRAMRQDLGNSQEELAGRAGLHRNYVGSVEPCERDLSVTALDRLARALGVSLVDFIETLPGAGRRRRLGCKSLTRHTGDARVELSVGSGNNALDP